MHRRPEDARAQGHRAADQHASPRRPHRRQQGLPPAQEDIVAPRERLKSHKKTTEAAENVDDQAYADGTFSETWSRKFGDETMWARYFGPGHTSGDAVIHFQQANVMPWGDLLFRRIHPHIDRAPGASAANWIKVLEPSRKTATTTPSSSSATARTTTRGTKADVMFFRDYLTAVLEHVRAGVKAGKSKDEVTKVHRAQGLRDDDRCSIRA